MAVETFPPISTVGVLEGNTASKMEHTIRKNNENGAYTWCQIVCSILFDLFLYMTSSGSKGAKEEKEPFELKCETVCTNTLCRFEYFSYVNSYYMLICPVSFYLFTLKRGGVCPGASCPFIFYNGLSDTHNLIASAF